ncbi:MAG: hypothetical protein H8D34_16020 [Chloroflexi bacterium]|nr:hypothetical protein [Chloroflexota bacterium]
MNQETILASIQNQDRLSWREIGIIGIHAFIGWALCTAAMGISMATTTVQNALIIHASAAPIIYTAVSLSYFNKFNFTKPLQTGLIFVSFVIIMDFFVVAMLVLKSFEMFYSPLGTWIPFTLIFLNTSIMGTLVLKRKKSQ